MESLYQAKGYYFAEVKVCPLEGTPSGILFDVAEGPRVRVEDIAFQGHDYFTHQQLAGLFSGLQAGFLGLAPRIFVPGEVESGKAAVKALYISEGFSSVEVAGPICHFSSDRRSVKLGFVIDEGQRYVIRAVEPAGGEIWAAVIDEPFLKLARELTGHPYNDQRRLRLTTGLQSIYGNAGYPDADITINQRLEGQGAVILQPCVNPGPQVTVAAILVEGNTEIAEAFILRQVSLRPGQRYELAEEQASLRRLYNTGFFSFVNLRLEGGGSQRRLRVTVTEAPLRGFSLELGANTYEYLRGEARYEDKNILRSHRRFRAGASWSFKSTGASAALIDPWLIRQGEQHCAGEWSLLIQRREEPAYSVEALVSRVGLSHALEPWLAMSAMYALAFQRLPVIQTDTVSPDMKTSYRTAGITLRVEADTRNDLFFPTTGQHSFLGVEGSHPVFGSDFLYGRLHLQTAVFTALAVDTIFAGRYSAGLLVVDPGQTGLPISERFFLGGDRSVRSMDRDRVGPLDAQGDPEGGLGFNLVNLELRQRIYGNFIATLFVDFGNIAPARDLSLEATFRDFFQGFETALGLGAAVLLPVGPLRIDGAFHPSAAENQPVFRLLFSMGMAF